MPLGLLADGSLDSPPTGFPAGWYTGAPTPGELGPAIIVGHVDWNGPAVFYKLHTLVADDEVSVTREDGSVAVFRVTEVAAFPKDAFPADAVYGGIDFAGLRLITCGGVFDHKTGHYEDNIIVFAKLVSSIRPPPPSPTVAAPTPAPTPAPPAAPRLGDFVPSIYRAPSAI
jgi:hypothetical protein